MPPTLQHFQAPFDWQVIDATVRREGGVILDGYLSPCQCTQLNQDFDAYLGSGAEPGMPATASGSYDRFLGFNTIRLHGLAGKVASTIDLIADESIVGWAERMVGSRASSVTVNAGEFIQIQPGEPRQYIHRDSDSWPMPLGLEPIVVNAIYALDDFTESNGATTVIPNSCAWPAQQRAAEEEMTQAVMPAGSVLLFRGDTLHGGGANNSDLPRRALSISYCAGWLRPVENGVLNLLPDVAQQLPERVRDLIGYAAYDGTVHDGGLVGLYENRDPRSLFAKETKEI